MPVKTSNSGHLVPLILDSFRQLLYYLYEEDSKYPYCGANFFLFLITKPSSMSMNFNNQTLNLKYRYGYRGERRITQEEIDSLRIIAMSYEPASGYARSIYHMLEGEVLPAEYPDLQNITNNMKRNSAKGDSESKEKQICEVSIYPNPAKDILYILSSSNRTLQNISLMSIDGRLVSSTTNIGMKKYSMDVSHLSAGIYIIKISTDNGENTIRKIIIK